MGRISAALLALGAAAITTGIALLSIPAGVIAGGVLLVALGVLNLETSRGDA